MPGGADRKRAVCHAQRGHPAAPGAVRFYHLNKSFLSADAAGGRAAEGGGCGRRGHHGDQAGKWPQRGAKLLTQLPQMGFGNQLSRGHLPPAPLRGDWGSWSVTSCHGAARTPSPPPRLGPRPCPQSAGWQGNAERAHGTGSVSPHPPAGGPGLCAAPWPLPPRAVRPRGQRPGLPPPRRLLTYSTFTGALESRHRPWGHLPSIFALCTGKARAGAGSPGKHTPAPGAPRRVRGDTTLRWGGLHLSSGATGLGYTIFFLKETQL